MGSVWITGDVITAARMNQKTNLIDTGANINSATPYTGMTAYCTTTGSGFTAGLTYKYNGTSWVLFGVASTLQVTDIYSSTIGDYTTPSSATASSATNATATIVIDTKGVAYNGVPSITTGSSPNRLLVLILNTFYSGAGSAGGASGITWNSLSMTKLTGATADQAKVSGDGEHQELWYLIAPTASTTASPVITFTGNKTGYTVGYWSFYNCDQVTGVQNGANNAGNTGSVSVAITGSATTNLIIGATGAAGGGTGPNQVQDWTNTSGSVMFGQHTSSTTVGSNTISVSVAATNEWAANGCEVIAFTGATTGNAVDGNTGTEWSSNSETHPYIYVDMGAAAFLTGAAIYWDSSSTVTQILVQTSPDASTWTTVRTINTSLFTNGAWNYFRWNLPNTALPRYVRFYGNDGTAKVFKLWEIKIKQYANTLGGLQSLFNVHGHPPISTSDATLALTA